MSEALKKIIADAREAFRADPEQAKATFQSISALQYGLRS